MLEGTNSQGNHSWRHTLLYHMQLLHTSPITMQRRPRSLRSSQGSFKSPRTLLVIEGSLTCCISDLGLSAQYDAFAHFSTMISPGIWSSFIVFGTRACFEFAVFLLTIARAISDWREYDHGGIGFKFRLLEVFIRDGTSDSMTNEGSCADYNSTGARKTILSVCRNGLIVHHDCDVDRTT